MTPNTSVLTLSAATTHNHKHGRGQMSLKCRLAACGNVSRPGFLHAKAGGNHLSPCRSSRVGRVTPASPLVAEMSRWHKHHIIFESFHLRAGKVDQCLLLFSPSKKIILETPLA